jgi:hypothetical protein
MTQETAAYSIKSTTENKKIEELKRKPMHGQFYQDLERPSVYKEKSLVRLCSSGLRGETESLITTDQDQALDMHYHHRNIMTQLTDFKCGMCYKAVSRATWLTAQGLLLRGSKLVFPSRTFQTELSSGNWLKRFSEREEGRGRYEFSWLPPVWVRGHLIYCSGRDDTKLERWPAEGGLETLAGSRG